jgi:aminopeptidase N
MQRRYTALLFTILLFGVSCGPTRKTTTVKTIYLDTLTVSAKNNPLDIYRRSEPRYWDIIHTRAALSFDMKERTADGWAWIKIKPYFYSTDSLILDAKSMDVKSVMLVGVTEPALSFQQRENQLKIRFNKSYDRTDTIQLYVKYTAKPYAELTGGSKAITDDRGLYFINTDQRFKGKPSQIWTQGETESNSHWLPTIDQPNERFTVQLELTVPDSFTTLSNGTLVKSSKQSNGFRTDTWSMDKPIQTYAIMFAIGNFSIVKDQPWNGKEVSYYVEPAFAPYAKKMFKNTPEMIAHFSAVTGVPYPWNKYSQVVVRDYVSGAMENTSATLFGEFINQNAREIADKDYENIVSHELFHQWFGDYVTAESWSNLTLNESFANYGEQLWRKHKYGKASNDELAYTDLLKYLNQTDYNDEPLVRFHYAGREDMFDRISYEKGGAILNYINGLIGDEAFHHAMNTYLTTNALQPAEAHNWRMAIEGTTGKDWNWFFNQWYYRGGHPILNLQYDYNDNKKQLVVNVRQLPSDSGSAYMLPMKAVLIYDNGEKEIVEWVVDKKKQSFTYPYRNGVKPLFIPDQEHWLPGLIQDTKKPAQWLMQLRQSDDYINKRRAVSGAFAAQTDTVSLSVFREGLKDAMDGIRLHTLSLLERVNDKNNWPKNLKDEVAYLAINDGSNRVRAAAWDVISKWKVKGHEAEMITALSDSSYLVAGAALEALSKANKDTAYAFTREILKQDPKGDLELAAWTIIAVRGEGKDIALFENQADYVYGTRKISFANFVNMYNLSTSSIESYERGLQLLTGLANNESIRSYRYALGSLVFGTAAYYRDQEKTTSDKKKPEENQRRQAIAEKYKKMVLENEKDPVNLDNYKEFERINK